MNEVVLIGRLARDPEIRYTQSQMAICHFTLAVDRPYSRNRREGDQTADFIRITVFDRQAENCSKYLTKGSQAAVQGRIQTGSYQNREGQTVYTTDVVANRVEFLGSRNSNQGGGYQNQGYSQNNYGGQGSYGNQSYGGQNNHGVNQGSFGGQGGSQNSDPAPAQAPAGGSQPDDLPEGFQTIDEDDIPF
ncbi:MAG: single-stranded DNA-binding protein [Anaerovoracaceae bacterium]|nr:single-stranded DNA-binding protein [Bacillota bacterium]MDY2670765.1 single-stranded DNA-binding protein [Anaerovoracaceae bacterium]